jgi:hypothetical protein
MITATVGRESAYVFTSGRKKGLARRKILETNPHGYSHCSLRELDHHDVMVGLSVLNTSAGHSEEDSGRRVSPHTARHIIVPKIQLYGFIDCRI